VLRSQDLARFLHRAEAQHAVGLGAARRQSVDADVLRRALDGERALPRQSGRFLGILEAEVETGHLGAGLPALAAEPACRPD